MMESFIDLMDDIIWTEVDILNRSESIIRQYYSLDWENILNRKITAALIGQYQLNETEVAEMEGYSTVCKQAQEAAAKSRVDNDLLKQTLEYERALDILSNVTSHSDTDVSWAWGIKNSASEAVVSLSGSRYSFRRA